MSLWAWPTGPAVLFAGPVLVVTTLFATPGSAAAGSAWFVNSAAGSAAHARSLALTPPTGVAATCVAPATSKTVTVTWNAVPHATSYSVYQSSTSSTSGYAVVATGVTGSTWTSGALKQNTTYWFEVSATVAGVWPTPNSAPTAGNVIHSRSPFCT